MWGLLKLPGDLMCTRVQDNRLEDRPRELAFVGPDLPSARDCAGCVTAVDMIHFSKQPSEVIMIPILGVRKLSLRKIAMMLKDTGLGAGAGFKPTSVATPQAHPRAPDPDPGLCPQNLITPTDDCLPVLFSGSPVLG